MILVTDLVQSNEGGWSNVVDLEIVDTHLSCVHGVTHYMIQCTTSCADGHIILVIYSPKIPLKKCTAGESLALKEALHNSQYKMDVYNKHCQDKKNIEIHLSGGHISNSSVFLVQLLNNWKNKHVIVLVEKHLQRNYVLIVQRTNEQKKKPSHLSHRQNNLFQISGHCFVFAPW